MAKTKAQLEAENTELRDELERAASPSRSEVNPGGGTFVGAVLHLRVPNRAGHADDRPSTTPAPESVVTFIGASDEGDVFNFPESYSLILADGGYARVERLRVLRQSPGVTLVEVL